MIRIAHASGQYSSRCTVFTFSQSMYILRGNFIFNFKFCFTEFPYYSFCIFTFVSFKSSNIRLHFIEWVCNFNKSSRNLSFSQRRYTLSSSTSLIRLSISLWCCSSFCRVLSCSFTLYFVLMSLKPPSSDVNLWLILSNT